MSAASLRASLAAAAILFAASLGVLAQERRIDELMRKSGLWEQVGQIQAQVRRSAEENRAAEKARGNAPLDDAQYERYTSAMQQAYAPERMRMLVKKGMAEALSIEDEREVLAWLSSDLGARITRLEEKSGELEEMTMARREGPAYLETVPPERMAMFAKLADAIRMGESGASMLINTTLAAAYGAALTLPGGDEGAVDALRERLESQRSQLAEVIGRQAVEMFAYIYRSLSDEALGRYVAFTETPAGRRYHLATTRALDRAFAQASLEIGRSLANAVSRHDRKS